MSQNNYIGSLSLSSKAISKLSELTSLKANGKFEVEKLEGIQYYFIKLEESSVVDDAILTNDTQVRLRYDNSFDHLLYQEAISNILSSAHQSMSLTYAQLSARMFDDIVSCFNLGSMLNEEQYEYARINHLHDYSNFTIQVGVKASDLSQYYDTSVDFKDYNEYIGTFITQEYTGNGYVNVSTDLFVPHIEIVKQQLSGYSKQIGELMFIATPSFMLQECELKDNYVVYDTRNDAYWAYPRGQIIACASNEFVDACKVFGNNGKTGNDTSFTIPCISSFIKLNPGTQKTNATQHIGFQTGLAQHKHNIIKNSSNDYISILANDVVISSDTTNGTGLGSTPHSGKVVSTTTYNNFTQLSCDSIGSDIRSRESNTVSTGVSSREFYPEYNDLPVLMYIGKKVYE